MSHSPNLAVALGQLQAAAHRAQSAAHAAHAAHVADVTVDTTRMAHAANLAADLAAIAADMAVDAKVRAPAGAPARAADMAQVAAYVARMAADAAFRADMAGATDTVLNAARVAEASTRVVDGVTPVVHAADAAVGALDAAARTFSLLPPRSSTWVDGAHRPLGRVFRNLADLAASVLPRPHRGRYREEWRSLLTELPTRRARARQLASLLITGAPRLSLALRRPINGSRPAGAP